MYHMASTYGITQAEGDALCIFLFLFIVLIGTIIQYVQSKPAP